MWEQGRRKSQCMVKPKLHLAGKRSTQKKKRANLYRYMWGIAWAITLRVVELKNGIIENKGREERSWCKCTRRMNICSTSIQRCIVFASKYQIWTIFHLHPSVFVTKGVTLEHSEEVSQKVSSEEEDDNEADLNQVDQKQWKRWRGGESLKQQNLKERTSGIVGVIFGSS